MQNDDFDAGGAANILFPSSGLTTPCQVFWLSRVPSISMSGTTARKFAAFRDSNEKSGRSALILH